MPYKVQNLRQPLATLPLENDARFTVEVWGSHNRPRYTLCYTWTDPSDNRAYMVVNHIGYRSAQRLAKRFATQPPVAYIEAIMLMDKPHIRYAKPAAGILSDAEVEAAHNAVIAKHPHILDAGFLMERVNPHMPGTFVCVYFAEQQGIDTGGAQYAVVCDAHGTILGARTLLVANAALRCPEQFCDGCREIVAAR